MNELSTNMIKPGMQAFTKIRFVLVAAVVSFLFSFAAYSQCGTDEFLDGCASNLGTYNYIRSFSANASQRKRADREFTYVFSKGSKYMMLACNEKLLRGKMIITLFDRNHDEIGKTTNEESGRDFPALKFECNTTGVYHIRISFTGSSKGCGMCILGISNDRN